VGSYDPETLGFSSQIDAHCLHIKQDAHRLLYPTEGCISIQQRFLSAYLKEQLERYRLYGEHEINDLCQCPCCLEARPPPELAGQSQNDTGIAQLPPLDMEEVMEEPTSQDGEGLGAATSSDGDIEYGADFSDDGDTVEVVEAPTETRTALPKSLPALAPKPTPPVPLFQAYQRTHPFSSPYLPTLYPPNMPHQHGYHHPTMPSVPHYSPPELWGGGTGSLWGGGRRAPQALGGPAGPHWAMGGGPPGPQERGGEGCLTWK
jgi:hypothetical protein